MWSANVTEKQQINMKRSESKFREGSQIEPKEMWRKGLVRILVLI